MSKIQANTSPTGNPMVALARNFLGDAPSWYKIFILCCLLVNPVLFQASPFFSGWVLVGEFIFTLAMALKCYPLLPGGLIAIEALFIGMTGVEAVKHEISNNLEVSLLLMFMGAGIHFIKNLLLLVFTNILFNGGVPVSIFRCINSFSCNYYSMYGLLRCLPQLRSK